MLQIVQYGISLHHMYKLMTPELPILKYAVPALVLVMVLVEYHSATILGQLDACTCANTTTETLKHIACSTDC